MQITIMTRINIRIIIIMFIIIISIIITKCCYCRVANSWLMNVRGRRELQVLAAVGPLPLALDVLG